MRGLGLTPPLFKLMIVRSSVNACCTSRQKSSSSARSAGVRPPARGARRRSCSRPSFFRDGMAAPVANSDSTKCRRLSIGSPSPECAAQQHSVGDQVDDYHQRSQHGLQRPRQSGRVQRREDVVLDEPAGVAFEAGAPAQGILERRERAHPALVFDHGPPDGAGEVQPRQPTPAPGEEPAQHDEAHERRVCQHDRVGKEAVAHLSSLPYTAKSPAGPEPDGGCVSPFGGRRSGAHEVLRRVDEVLQRFLEAVRQLPQPAERIQLVQRELAAVFVSDRDRKSTRLNSSHVRISYAVFCLKKKKKHDKLKAVSSGKIKSIKKDRGQQLPLKKKL